MRIGVLTVPFNNNYGGMLQAYALKTVLTEMGHDVVIINRRRNRIQNIKFKIYRLFVQLHIIDDYIEKRIIRISKNTNLFKEKYLTPITEPYYTSNDLKKCVKIGFDYYIVGSDQVWRFRYALDSIDDYYFGFIDDNNVPRMSYAASFGIDDMDYPETKKERISCLLQHFRGISVREKSGKDILEKYFQIPSDNVKVVLDPTFLLSKVDYFRLIKNEPNERSPYIFTYILDDSLDIRKYIDDLRKELGIGQIDIKAQTGKMKNLEIIEPVEKWLSSVYYSDYVITDSFHGTVFSIIFNRPFVVYANITRGTTRLDSLLSQFGLTDRMIELENKNLKSVLLKPIDWNSVNKKKKELIQESYNFLEKTLNLK